MGRKLDGIWKYAEKLDGHFLCKFCETKFPGGCSRLKSHLSGIEGRGIDVCPKVSETAQNEAILAIVGSNKKPKKAVDLIVQGDGSNHSGSISGSTKDSQQSTVLDLLKKNKNKSTVDYLLAKHFISNNIAFDVMQTLPFQEFVRSVAAYGPGYEIPSYSILETKVIPDCVTKVDEYIKNAKKKWVTTGCTLVYDIWADIHQRAFLKVIAYSPGGAVFMNSSVITRDGNTCVLIEDFVSSVSSVIDDIGPDHVVQLITNNVPNFESAADMLIAKYPRMYKTKCAADGVQLLLKDIHEHVHWVRIIIDDAKEIVRYMCGHSTVLSLVRQYTNNRELKHSCTIRFASNFIMLKSLLDVENELRSLVASPQWGALDCNKGEMAKKVTDKIQNSDFWSQGTEVLQALEPLVQVLRLVEGEGSTSGYLYEAMERAKESIRERYHNDEAKYMIIWCLFEKRQQIIVHPIHAAAAFLNPSYMCSENFKEDSRMKDGIHFMLENLVSNDESESFIEQIQMYRAKVSTLFTVTAKTMLKTSHPRVWWDYCGDSLPILKKYAIRILSQPCSSASCERNRSAFEAAQTKKRNRFTPQILNNLVHVRMNMLMMEKFNTIEAEVLMPIDLEKLRELPEYFDPPKEDGEDRVRSLTQDNLNYDTGMFTENGYNGDQAHSVIGNWELDRSMTEQHGGDEGGAFGSIEVSSTPTTFADGFTFEVDSVLMRDGRTQTLERLYLGQNY